MLVLFLKNLLKTADIRIGLLGRWQVQKCERVQWFERIFVHELELDQHNFILDILHLDPVDWLFLLLRLDQHGIFHIRFTQVLVQLDHVVDGHEFGDRALVQQLGIVGRLRGVLGQRKAVFLAEL